LEARRVSLGEIGWLDTSHGVGTSPGPAWMSPFPS
jgi:hypothetical protein